MKDYPKTSPAPDWDAIFKKRPELEAPGYHETIKAIKQSKEQTNEDD